MVDEPARVINVIPRGCRRTVTPNAGPSSSKTGKCEEEVCEKPAYPYAAADPRQARLVDESDGAYLSRRPSEADVSQSGRGPDPLESLPRKGCFARALRATGFTGCPVGHSCPQPVACRVEAVQSTGPLHATMDMCSNIATLIGSLTLSGFVLFSLCGRRANTESVAPR